MLTVKSRHAWTWAAVVLVVAALTAGTQLFHTGGVVTAYQPDGQRVSEWEMPDMPCPYGHDDACEGAASPPSMRLYMSANPHDLLPHVATDNRHFDEPVDIEHFRQRISYQNAQPGPRPVVATDSPTSTSDDVNYDITTLTSDLPWVADGQTPAERLLVDWLAELSEVNPALADSLVNMPFLQDYTPGDRQAVQTLALISERDPEDAADIANRAKFADDGGLDNTEAKIVAVLWGPYRDDETHVIDDLITSGTVEEHDTVGEYRTQLVFSIVRTISRQNDEGNSTLMETAISATQHAETLMAQALPTDFIGILVSDVSGAAARNNGIMVQVDDRFDDPSYDERIRQRVIAHEIGHYWWTGRARHERWISEGAAEYMGAYSVKTRFGDRELWLDTFPCPYYRTIEHLRADNPNYRSNGSSCNYSLGGRLFINLDRSMTGSAFHNAFRNFHQRLSTYEDDEIDQGLNLVRAFCPACERNPRNLSGTGYTLGYRYGQKVFTDNSRADGSIPGLGEEPSISFRDYRNNRQYGVPIVPSTGPDQDRWIRLWFTDAENPPESVTVRIVQYHQDREPWYDSNDKRIVGSNDNDAAWFSVYLGNPDHRPIGHHWVYVYNEDGDKIAEAEYQVVP